MYQQNKVHDLEKQKAKIQINCNELKKKRGRVIVKET